jgi:predicted nuclease with TOPRIM domain
MNEKFIKRSEILKKNQTEKMKMKTSISQIKNSVESLHNRLDEVEERILELTDRFFKIITFKGLNLFKAHCMNLWNYHNESPYYQCMLTEM